MSQSLTEQFKKDAEGKLYVHRTFSDFMSDTVHYSESFYVVRNGVVFFIQSDLTERQSGDTVIDTVSSCKCLGGYSADKIKREKFTYLSIDKLRKKFIEK